MRIWLSVLLIVFISEQALARQCREVFVSSNPEVQSLKGGVTRPDRVRSLTHIYLQRNFQFPLHMNLIQAGMAADIVVHRIRPESTVELNRAAHALNRLHRVFSVPIRVETPGFVPEAGMRVISRDVLQGLIEAMLSDNFSTLQRWGYLNQALSARDLQFWGQIKRFFDSQQVHRLSLSYREDVTRPLGAEQLLSVKEYYHDRIMTDLLTHLEGNLPGGLTSGERAFLSQNQIF